MGTDDDGAGLGGAAGDDATTPRGGSAGNGGSSGSSGEAGSGGEPDTACTTDSPPEAPLRHLTRFEYDNTVRDLFGDKNRPAQALPRDADDQELAVSAAVVEGYHRLAHDFARSVTPDAAATSAFIGCDPASDGETACRREFIESFVGRVFRRPASSDDLAAFSSVFASGQSIGGDFSAGVRAVVEVALESPEFLYRPELGEPAADRGAGWARPTPYEMASRLSYLFWASTPDATLLEAAQRDELREPDELDAQARRLLAAEPARDAVGHFYLRLLHLVDAEFPASGSAEHPAFTAAIAELLPAETATFAAELTLGTDSDFSALLTEPSTFVNGPLADFYGISGISGDAFRRADLAGSQRAGLLTQASVLASSANGVFTDPGRRGHLVATAFLCLPIPAEPPSAFLLPPLPQGMTTREQYQEATSDAACAGCHGIMNPLGFAFEHFDAAGLWRETENGLPIDTSGELRDTDAAGPFDGALELAHRLAASEDARRCFVQNWFTHAHGRSPTSADACSLETLDRAFVRENQNLRELLVALTQNDSFRYLSEVTP
ncbi:MAG TPA: DUF1592 domain-containing protein [Polyangiaceae bacterium]|nr:DUF1592 domain-containing protein [Polyangiaceae bacterium]